MSAYIIDRGGAVHAADSALLGEQSVRILEYVEVLKAVESTEPSDKLGPRYGTPIDGVTCAKRPFELSLFAHAVTVNTFHARAIRAKVKDIAERGWSVRARNAGMQRQLTDMLEAAFGDRSLAEGLGCVWADYETLGNGYLEILRDGHQLPRGFRHVPAIEMWPTLDGMGFVQQVDGAASKFRRYGMDSPWTDRNQVAALVRYSPWSVRYGVPNILPAWKAVMMHDLIHSHNLRYFTHAAVPDWAVLVEGEAGEETIRVVREYFQTHLKGAKKSVLMVETTNAKITFQRLSDAQKDGSFSKLVTQCRDEVLVAHGVPPQKVGISEAGKLGGNLSNEQERSYRTSIVKPGHDKLSSLITRLLREHDPDAEFVLDPYDIDERAMQADIDERYIRAQVVTAEEIRRLRFPDLEAAQ